MTPLPIGMPAAVVALGESHARAAVALAHGAHLCTEVVLGKPLTPAGTHTNEACSGTNCGFLAYNEGVSRRDLDIF